MGQFDQLEKKEELIGVKVENMGDLPKKEESVAVPNAEELQAKEDAKAENKIADQKRIDELKDELIGENSLEISGIEAYNIYSQWKEVEIKKIGIKAKEMEGQKDSIGINYKYDRQFNSMNLESGGEIKFIEFASNEGNQKDINAALKLLSIYHRDRSDLKDRLEKKLAEIK